MRTTCSATTSQGKRCQGSPSDNGLCGCHQPNRRTPKQRSGWEKKKLIERARALRNEGYSLKVISHVLGISHHTASAWCWWGMGLPKGVKPKSLPSHNYGELKRAQRKQAAHLSKQEMTKMEKERKQNIASAHRELEEEKEFPSWTPFYARIQPRNAYRSEAELTELEDLMEKQKRDERWGANCVSSRLWLISLDAPEPWREGSREARIDFLRATDSLNPEQFLISKSEKRALSGLDEAQIAKMSHCELDALRAKMIALGVEPPSVQAA